MHQDYIMRMFQQMTSFLMRAVMLRKSGKPQEAIDQITEAYGTLTGVDQSLVHAFSDEDLISLLRTRGVLDTERAVSLAELLREEGHAFEDLGQIDTATLRYFKALRLYLEVFPDLEELGSHFDPAVIKDLLDRIDPGQLPFHTFELLLHHYESTGQFDEAENVLFHYLDDTEDNAEIVNFGQNFYRRLLLQSDEALQHGGLTRAEVEDGLAQLTNIL